MIVSPNKGVFFVATALMCSASLYGAELSALGGDPLTRIFVGEPNRLTLPPGFPETAELTLGDENCSSPVSDTVFGGPAVHTASASAAVAEGCRAEAKPGPGATVLPGTLTTTARAANAQANAPTSVSTTAQTN
jgi:hypothetical protein